MQIYYDDEGQMGVNVTYHLNGEKHHDYFSSMYKFNSWINYECLGAEVIEVTNENYPSLCEQGLL
ncbi:hypothetical protein [Thalassotalea sp. PLHSN55]|uniref:hypothetical protein n=1 Tax=Thalassotalea sp. PLHSN55 TaxID=3435888 RepID=UPI003F86F04B